MRGEGLWGWGVNVIDIKLKYDSTLLKQIIPFNSQISIHALILVAEPVQQPMPRIFKSLP